MRSFTKKILILFMAIVVLSLFVFIGAGQKEGSTQKKEKPVLSIICFKGYAEPSWVKPFEEKYR